MKKIRVVTILIVVLSLQVQAIGVDNYSSFDPNDRLNGKIKDIEAFRTNKSNNNKEKQKKYISSEMTYIYQSDLTINYAFINNKVKIIFGECGGNNIFGIKGIEFSEGSNRLSIVSCTDWVGPYVVRLKTGGKRHSKQHFTGGWHTVQYDGLTEKTARTLLVKVYANGKKVEDKGDIVLPIVNSCEEIRIVVVNGIKSYNYNGDTLEETVEYIIKGGKIRVNVETTALKPVVIEKYYGIQTQNAGFDKIRYVFSDRSVIISSALKWSSSGRKIDGKELNRLILSSSEHGFQISAKIKPITKINDYDSVDTNKPYAFSSNGKSYFNLINGTPLELNKGESFAWQGEYRFE